MKTIITVAALFFVVSISQAQKNFYEAIEANGETTTYEGFAGKSANGDGTYNFERGVPAVKLTVKRLATGQPVGFKAVPVLENYGGFSETELSDYGRVDSYPNVMSIKHDYTDDGYMMIDDLLFVVDNIPDNGVPKLGNVTSIFVMVKDRAETKAETGKKKKKKGGLLGRMKAKLKNAGRKTSPAFKYIKTVNIEKKFNDYVTAMKTKQAIPLTSKDKADIAKIKRAREAGDEEIKRYNDSIRATPAHKKLVAHQARMKQMDNNNAKKTVTIINKTGKDIYVYKEGSRNGTRINSNSYTKVDCSFNYTYKFDSNSGGAGSSCYTANSGCDRSVTIK
ncbi:hypothetical protein [Lacinutrix jangbogonensis]|uniref:hypothetical protein n=1 Tax=Lacinutrix jangbogonensis TaxID=1469557 RepID=UPI00053DD01E|nr:hypothetical protein [Lacinutrix jangbogonensis]